MKKYFLLLLFPLMLQAQEPQIETSLFVALYTVGGTWDVAKEPQEQAYFQEHSAFLSKLRKDGIIEMGARFGETGMIVFKESDLVAAKALLHEDIALQNELFNVEVHPFNVFYKGCVD